MSTPACTPATTQVFVKAHNTTYSVPTEILSLASVTFDKAYARSLYWKGNVPGLASTIASELMPASREDPFSEQRLAACILSLKGRAKGKAKGKQVQGKQVKSKKNQLVSLSSVPTQLVLFQE